MRYVKECGTSYTSNVELQIIQDSTYIVLPSSFLAFPLLSLRLSSFLFFTNFLPLTIFFLLSFFRFTAFLAHTESQRQEGIGVWLAVPQLQYLIVSNDYVCPLKLQVLARGWERQEPHEIVHKIIKESWRAPKANFEQIPLAGFQPLEKCLLLNTRIIFMWVQTLFTQSGFFQ